MEERFSISYNQAYPRVPRCWASSEFNSRLGLTKDQPWIKSIYRSLTELSTAEQMKKGEGKQCLFDS
jgi:hypothetical protein